MVRPWAEGPLVHVRDELISPSWNCDYVLMVTGLFTERLPENRNIPGQPTFLHNRVAPNPLKQLVLRDHPPRLFDHRKQRLECLGRQCHGFSVAEQQPSVGIQTKRSELERSV